MTPGALLGVGTLLLAGFLAMPSFITSMILLWLRHREATVWTALILSLVGLMPVIFVFIRQTIHQ